MEESAAAFGRLLQLLPDEYKHLLLLEALETCGPACLVGLEAARDAILLSAVRHEPALLRSVTSFLEGGDEEDSTDGPEGESAATGIHDAGGDAAEDDEDSMDGPDYSTGIRSVRTAVAGASASQQHTPAEAPGADATFEPEL
jgi:hypothetical protein